MRARAGTALGAAGAPTPREAHHGRQRDNPFLLVVPSDPARRPDGRAGHDLRPPRRRRRPPADAAGPAGVGKTRLALAAAADLAADPAPFPDGVIFVDLTPVGEPTLVLASLASAVGLLEIGGRPALERHAAGQALPLSLSR